MWSEEYQTIMISLEDLVPQDHFFRQLKDLFPWDKWAKPFEKCFKGEKEYGPKGYPVSVLLKMTVISFLYNLSDFDTEEFVRDNTAGRFFVGLGLHQRVPDETTLVRFRGRITQKGKIKYLEELFDKILLSAPEKGVEIGVVRIIDSVHTNSKINPNKKDKNDNNNNNNNKIETNDVDSTDTQEKVVKINPKDPDARWGCKGTKKVKDPETGKEYKVKKSFFGYKSHVSIDSRTNLITSLTVSAGNAPDCYASVLLLESNRLKGIKTTVVTADKAYDELDMYVYCGKHNIFPAIALKKCRTEQKSEKNRKHWEEHKKLPYYKKALGKRYKVEQKFGEAKMHHGFDKCRYIGELKYLFQAAFTFMSMNLKRMVKLINAGLSQRRLKLCKT